MPLAPIHPSPGASRPKIKDEGHVIAPVRYREVGRDAGCRQSVRSRVEFLCRGIEDCHE